MSKNSSDSAFVSLSDDEWKLITLLSIAFEPLGAGDMVDLLNKCDVRAQNGRKFTASSVPEVRRSLVSKGLLQKDYIFSGVGYFFPSAELREDVMRHAASESGFAELASKVKFARSLNYYYSYNRRDTVVLRDFRIAIYLAANGLSEFDEQAIGAGLNLPRADGLLSEIFGLPFQPEKLRMFPVDFQHRVLALILANNFGVLSNDDIWKYIDDLAVAPPAVVNAIRADELLVRGELGLFEELLAQWPAGNGSIFPAGFFFIKGEFERCVEAYEAFWNDRNPSKGKRKSYPHHWITLVYGLAICKARPAKFGKFVNDYCGSFSKNQPISAIATALRSVESFVKNDVAGAREAFGQIRIKDFVDEMVAIITARVVHDIAIPPFTKAFEDKARSLGFEWAAKQATALLHGDWGDDSPDSIGNLIPKLEDWERALDSLIVIGNDLSAPQKTSQSAGVRSRIVWLVDFEYHQLQPIEQRRTAAGWTSGRNVSLKKMHEGKAENLDEFDRRIVGSALKRQRDYYYSGYSYDFEWEKAIHAMAGHPRIVNWIDRSPVEIIAAEPSLLIEEKNGTLEMRFDIQNLDQGARLVKDSDNKYRLIEVSKKHIEIERSLNHGRLVVPAAGREKLREAMRILGRSIPIQSDVEEHFEDLPEAEPDPRIHALITPAGDSYGVRFQVKPFGSVPPYFVPGSGSTIAVATVEGERKRVRRDRDGEVALARSIISRCSSIAVAESDTFDWLIDGTASLLRLLDEFEQLRNENILAVEWPQGERIRVIGSITNRSLGITVKTGNDWFTLDGEVRVNEGLVVSLREISRKLKCEHSGFIELSDGQYLAITESLRQKLDALERVSDSKGRIHRLRAGLIGDLADSAESFRADKGWKESIETARLAMVSEPVVPATFEGDLRPYQIEGYKWLSRLSKIGAGACLADDMGLGKTVMALAVLVQRAELGPALVVAPVSVTRNWVNEAKRFAPTLRVAVLGLGDRRQQIDEASAYDVVVTSYSLLQIEADWFKKKRFSTVILDEAQAIKNRNTKRAQSAMALDSDFRIIMTGTPVENRLGELWSLFNFINPGLLGSEDSFNERFAVPIERDGDADARRALRGLIRPFLLRRRKNEVLNDLPEKTEIMLSVELTELERAAYETIRREAIERIDAAEGDPIDKRFLILAELTRLRLACCHPSLADIDAKIPSSKLGLFGETIRELLEGNHRTLVFSQFVKHLKLVEKHLRENGIRYLYLDGGTAGDERQRRVESFQRGEAEVFLISLKAGGSGLNLTAADYVIHLDPWWNPAVEDQASDRAHRIGQQRPVTVYRLIASNTVEEKILRLHETKRDLADRLLEGMDAVAKFSNADLLAIISDL